MGINGLKVELTAAEGHPKAFVDALYTEFFDLHPDASTVDLAIAVKDTTSEEDRKEGKRASFEIIDARIMRVTDPAWDSYDGPLNASMHRYLDPAGDTEEGPFGLLREMVRWASSLDGLLVWVRKTPEGQAQLTEQEAVWHEGIRAIDLATGDGKAKQYRLGVIVNRNASQPLSNHGIPQPVTGFADIDNAITEKIVRRPIEKYNLAPDSKYVIAAEAHLAAQRVINGHEDEHGQPHHMAAHETIVATSKVMGREVARIALEDPNTVPAEKEAAQRMLAMIEMTELLEKVAQQPAPQAPPSPFPGLPRDILTLPQFQLPAQDNAKPQIGFRSPEERDRLN